jgi:PEP-CTERM motif
MRALQILTALLLGMVCSAPMAAPKYSGAPLDPTAADATFDISGTINISQPPTPTSTLGGSITLNTLTGTITAADVTFSAPNPQLTNPPALTFFGPEIGPGPAGSHFYEFELCAVAGCAGNWVLEVGLSVTPTNPSLIGYEGGAISALSLVYSTIADPWGGCNSGCGTLAASTAPSGGGSGAGSSAGSGGGSACGGTSTSPTTGVPEPATLSLLLLGFGMLGFSARPGRRRG